MDVATVKEQYGKQKCRKLVQPLYDPLSIEPSFTQTGEQKALLLALQRENEDQLNSNTTGNVAKYGSSCLLKLMEHSSSESNSCTSDDAAAADDDDAAADDDDAADARLLLLLLMLMMIVMACVRVNNTWFLAGRVRVTASIAKDIQQQDKRRALHL